jgi:hypothetical protein
MGEIQGTLCISGPINLRKCKSGDLTRSAQPARNGVLSICVLNCLAKIGQLKSTFG